MKDAKFDMLDEEELVEEEEVENIAKKSSPDHRRRIEQLLEKRRYKEMYGIDLDTLDYDL